MKNRNRSANLYIIAGPNGAGKTTFARKIGGQIFILDFAKNIGASKKS